MFDTINRLIWGIALLAWIGLLALSVIITFGDFKPAVSSANNLQARLTYDSVPDFSLIDQNGQERFKSDWKGKIWIVDFIFTRCEMQCKMMTRNMRSLTKQLPENVKFISVSVDPNHDRPPVLRGYRKKMKADAKNWTFLTGTEKKIKEMVKEKFNLPLARNSEDSGNILTHSNRFVLVDTRGRIRGYYRPNITGEMNTLKRNVNFLIWESKAHDRPDTKILGLVPLSWFPELNSLLNLVAGLFLFVGFYFIKTDRTRGHVTAMVSALFCTGLFLVCYLTYHSYHGSTPFPGEGSIRTMYFSILISHTVLAALLPFLVPVLLYFAVSENYSKHRGLGRWTLPLWLYVSATGVIVYLFLYRYFWAPPY